MSRDNQSQSVTTASRSLTDDEIIATVQFAFLNRRGVPDAEYGMALIASAIAGSKGIPLTLVTWPTGVRALVPLKTGETSGTARALLLSTYRSAESGCLGPIAVGMCHG